jgi:hypothetical protein
MAEVDTAATFLEQEGNFQLAYSLAHDEGTFFVLVNAHRQPKTFELGTDLSGALILVDGVSASADGIGAARGVQIDGTTVTLDGLTPALIVLR